MALAWHDEPKVLTPHTGLEPVSAWQFLRSRNWDRSNRRSGEPQFAAIIESDWYNAAKLPPAKTFVALNTAHHGRGVLRQRSIEKILQDRGITMSAPRIFVVPLAERSLSKVIKTSGLSRVPTPRSNFAWHGRGAEAIVGIIDHGINFFHHRFRISRGRSRVVYAWSQGGTFDDDNLEVPFGREWTPDDISKAIRRNSRDEDALIRLLDTDFSIPGLHPLAFRSTHGTHVLDVAAGFDVGDPRGRSLPIVAVNLPPEVSRETSGSLLGLFFLQGFAYILARARRVMETQRRALPVMVNFSFGLSGGPRGGQHFVEQAMDGLIRHHNERLVELDLIRRRDRTPAVDIILPAGNRNLAAGHVGIANESGLHATWQLQPADRTANFMEVRIETEPGEPAPVIELSLSPPGADKPMETQLRPNGPAKWLQDRTRVICRAAVHYGGMGDGRSDENTHVLTLALAETEPSNYGDVPAAAGPWLLGVRLLGRPPRRIDAWILRDDTPPGYRDRGRQSYFVDPKYLERNEQGHLMHQDPKGADKGILRAGTLNAIATGTPRRIVGGQIGGQADEKGGVKPAPYSANPLPGTTEQVTDWAICERSSVLPGIIAAGTRSGTRVAVNGTSVAAPQVLRRLISDIVDP